MPKSPIPTIPDPEFPPDLPPDAPPDLPEPPIEEPEPDVGPDVPPALCPAQLFRRKCRRDRKIRRGRWKSRVGANA